MTTKKAYVARAYELGQIAFNRGHACIPAFDSAMMALMAENPGPMGYCIPALKAWHKGWHEANLNCDMTALSRTETESW
jgi:hypothetical protein